VFLFDSVFLFSLTGSDIKDHFSLFLLLPFGESATIATRAGPTLSTIALLCLVFS
jgi:hypothetical protein